VERGSSTPHLLRRRSRKPAAILRHALALADLDPHKAIVDYLHVEPADPS
jgi:hypothetical protein